MPPLIVQGVSKQASEQELIATIQQVLMDATDNLAWLKPGDTVLLKPALNSPNPYPATTHPLSVLAIQELLTSRGANVVIGDQSGIEHVVHGPKGVIKGSTIKNFETAGIVGATPRVAPASKSRVVGFEQDAWESFTHVQTDQTQSWKNGFYVTPWIEKVDHIINLPRVSTHAQAGVTLGFKNLVGILREDSRLEFHANGPFNAFITSAARGSNLESRDDGSQKFIEKIVEISIAIKDKLRATLFTATKAQTTFGPDAQLFPGLRSYVAAPETGLVFASADPVAAEAMAISYLTHLYQTETPDLYKFLQRILVRGNGRIKELGTESIFEQPVLKHAIKLGLGSSTISPIYTNVSKELEEQLEAFLKK